MNTAPNAVASNEVRPATTPEIIGHHVNVAADTTVHATVCVGRGLISGVISGWNKGMKRNASTTKYFVDTNGNIITKE